MPLLWEVVVIGCLGAAKVSAEQGFLGIHTNLGSVLGATFGGQVRECSFLGGEKGAARTKQIWWLCPVERI